MGILVQLMIFAWFCTFRVHFIQSNAVEEVIQKLKKSNIAKPDESVMLVISKSTDPLNYCNVETHYAVNLCKELKDAPTINTKNFLTYDYEWIFCKGQTDIVYCTNQRRPASRWSRCSDCQRVRIRRKLVWNV